MGECEEVCTVPDRGGRVQGSKEVSEKGKKPSKEAPNLAQPQRVRRCRNTHFNPLSTNEPLMAKLKF